MRRTRHALALLCFLTACSSSVVLPEDTEGGSTEESGDESSTGAPGVGLRPFRDDWRTVIDQPFSADVRSVIVGDEGRDNFNNRGDVIVRYADAPRIVVEMRRFTMATSQAEADADFERMSIWGTDAALPQPPYDLAPAFSCVDPMGQTPWRDGCQVAVFYDDTMQPSWTGADLRVTLPRSYIYDLLIATEDNDFDSDYQNRGNVCVEGLPGSVDVSLSNGSAWVILDENMPEMPECPADLRAECESSNWDPSTCGCFSQGYAFSQVLVRSNDGQSPDATVDVPAGDFWVAYNMRNDGGTPCAAAVDDDVGTVTLAAGVDLDAAPWANMGSIDYPGEPATEGAGFSIQLVADACAAILSTESPEDFGGQGSGPEQAVAQRGNFRICAGCARSLGCEGLVPG